MRNYKRKRIYHSSLVHDVFAPIKSQHRLLKEVMERKSIHLKNDIGNALIPALKHGITIKSLKNLTEYTATRSKPRHELIKKAFDVLVDLVGFDYNEKGSFTDKGADNQFKDDVRFRIYNKERTKKLSIEVSGRLEQMEKGKISWNSLRKFFYNRGVKTALLFMAKPFIGDFYNDLNRLFSYTNDPTMPNGRKYISLAIERSALEFHENMKESIAMTFNNNGYWRQTTGRGVFR